MSGSINTGSADLAVAAIHLVLDPTDEAAAAVLDRLSVQDRAVLLLAARELGDTIHDTLARLAGDRK